MKNIVLWSTPRSHSTALAYSFGNRNDTVVIDEPLYASWLVSSGTNHQGRELVIEKAQGKDQSQLIQGTLQGDLDIKNNDKEPKIRFWKHIAKHYNASQDNDKSWLWREDVFHVFLVREPRRIIRSWVKVEKVTNEDIGLDILVNMYNLLQNNPKIKNKPILLDAKYLALDPEGVLQTLCNQLQIPFEKNQMLSWQPGKRDFDIANAKFWYSEVWKSSGFLPYHAEDFIHFSNEEDEKLASNLDILYKSLQVYKNSIRRESNAAYVGAGKDTHDLLPDNRNANIQVWVSDLGGLVPREQARVSVFDSSVQGGDHVWEGFRIYEGKIFAMQHHIDRLLNSAKALGYNEIPKAESIEHAIFETLKANNMRDGVHIRLTLTRGTKVTSSMNPLFNKFGCTLIVLAEWKESIIYSTGFKLITSSVRRNTPAILDSKIHHGNMIHLILAKMQANFAKVDDAIMLDVNGFVAETNSCNIFAVIAPNGYPDKRILITSRPDACLNGITRQIILKIAQKVQSKYNFTIEERNVSLSEFHSAIEVFVTGTMGGIAPVIEIDGRSIGNCDSSIPIEQRYPLINALQDEYLEEWQTHGTILPF